MRFLKVWINDNNNNKQILKVEVIIIIMRFLKVWINDENNNNKQMLKVRINDNDNDEILKVGINDNNK